MSTLEDRIVRCTQGSHDWFMARCGRVTASDVAKTMAFRKRGADKGESLAARDKYQSSIIAEILSGEPDMEGYATGPMNRGIDEEPLAAEAYAVATGAEVEKVGFVLHPTIPRAGASPDRLVDNDGILEMKNPKTKTHIQYLRTRVIPELYEPQVMFELACTEREWCDYMGFDSRMPYRYQLRVDRVYRDEVRIAEINAAVVTFLDEVDEIIEELERLYPEIPVVRSDPKQAVKDQLRRAVEEDPSLLITNADLPAWARTGKYAPTS